MEQESGESRGKFGWQYLKVDRSGLCIIPVAMEDGVKQSDDNDTIEVAPTTSHVVTQV